MGLQCTNDSHKLSFAALAIANSHRTCRQNNLYVSCNAPAAGVHAGNKSTDGK
jgi:hypothetical protein